MLRKNKQITLVSITYTQDSDGFRIETESESTIWAQVDSVTGQEFTNAGLLNIQPSFRAVVWVAEYDGQKIVEMDGKRFGVYRTYKRNSEEIELYCQEEMGLNQ